LGITNCMEVSLRLNI